MWKTHLENPFAKSQVSLGRQRFCSVVDDGVMILNVHYISRLQIADLFVCPLRNVLKESIIVSCLYRVVPVTIVFSLL